MPNKPRTVKRHVYHCFACSTEAPYRVHKHGWHKLVSVAGVVYLCPKCTAEKGLPAPVPPKPRAKKKEGAKDDGHKDQD